MKWKTNIRRYVVRYIRFISDYIIVYKYLCRVLSLFIYICVCIYVYVLILIILVFDSNGIGRELRDLRSEIQSREFNRRFYGNGLRYRVKGQWSKVKGHGVEAMK